MVAAEDQHLPWNINCPLSVQFKLLAIRIHPFKHFTDRHVTVKNSRKTVEMLGSEKTVLLGRTRHEHLPQDDKRDLGEHQ